MNPTQEYPHGSYTPHVPGAGSAFTKTSRRSAKSASKSPYMPTVAVHPKGEQVSEQEGDESGEGVKLLPALTVWKSQGELQLVANTESPGVHSIAIALVSFSREHAESTWRASSAEKLTHRLKAVREAIGRKIENKKPFKDAQVLIFSSQWAFNNRFSMDTGGLVSTDPDPTLVDPSAYGTTPEDVVRTYPTASVSSIPQQIQYTQSYQTLYVGGQAEPSWYSPVVGTLHRTVRTQAPWSMTPNAAGIAVASQSIQDQLNGQSTEANDTTGP